MAVFPHDQAVARLLDYHATAGFPAFLALDAQLVDIAGYCGGWTAARQCCRRLRAELLRLRTLRRCALSGQWLSAGNHVLVPSHRLICQRLSARLDVALYRLIALRLHTQLSRLRTLWWALGWRACCGGRLSVGLDVALYRLIALRLHTQLSRLRALWWALGWRACCGGRLSVGLDVALYRLIALRLYAELSWLRTLWWALGWRAGCGGRLSVGLDVALYRLIALRLHTQLSRLRALWRALGRRACCGGRLSARLDVALYRLIALRLHTLSRLRALWWALRRRASARLRVLLPFRLRLIVLGLHALRQRLSGLWIDRLCLG
jgi:hypothetical protein